MLTVFAFGLYVACGAVWGYGLLIDVGGYWLHSQAIPSVILGLIFLDLMFLTLPGHRRGIDWIFKLRIGHSSQLVARPAT
jgi:hypothetical protein